MLVSHPRESRVILLVVVCMVVVMMLLLLLLLRGMLIASVLTTLWVPPQIVVRIHASACSLPATIIDG